MYITQESLCIYTHIGTYFNEFLHIMCRLHLQCCYTSVGLLFHREKSWGVGGSRVVVEQREQLHQSDRFKVAVRSLL